MGAIGLTIKDRLCNWHLLGVYCVSDWFQIGKGVHQGCVLSPCLFNFYAEYIMRNAGLDKAQAGIKIARRNINNLKYADNTTLTAESEEELKCLLMKAKEGKGGMFWENSIETSILSRVKQTTSPGWMHETSARGWYTGKTQRDGMGREAGGGTHVNPWLIHVSVWQKPL